MIKLTTDKSTVVETNLKWIPITTVQPPTGAKCLVIDRKYGVARIDVWSGNIKASHWHPLPTFLTAEDDA